MALHPIFATPKRILITGVRIYQPPDNHGNRVSYIAKCKAECRDDVDRSIYEEALRHGDTITMGQVIAQPLFSRREN